MAGYDINMMMSNNAVEAIASGELPASDFAVLLSNLFDMEITVEDLKGYKSSSHHHLGDIESDDVQMVAFYDFRPSEKRLCYIKKLWDKFGTLVIKYSCARLLAVCENLFEEKYEWSDILDDYRSDYCD